MRQQVVDSVEAEGEPSSVLLMLNVSITPISFILNTMCFHEAIILNHGSRSQLQNSL